MLLLGIETSCDDTATAVVRDGRDVLSSVSTNQDEFHRKYGGIVPEIASRRHVALLSAAVEDSLDRAGATFEAIDGIAVTAGPGLIGSLVVGVASAKALAFALDKPLYAVNHLHGHLFAPFLDRVEKPPYPFLALLVSGGHSQLVAVDSPMQSAFSAERTTTPPAKRTTRPHASSAYPIPAAPSSIVSRKPAIRKRTRFRAIVPQTVRSTSPSPA